MITGGEPAPFITEWAQDGERFSVWDGSTLFGTQRSKRSDFLVHCTGPGGYYSVGPFELEDVVEMFCTWRRFRGRASGQATISSPGGFASTSLPDDLCGDMYAVRGTRTDYAPFAGAPLLSNDERDVVAPSAGEPVLSSTPGWRFEGRSDSETYTAYEGPPPVEAQDLYEPGSGDVASADATLTMGGGLSWTFDPPWEPSHYYWEMPFLFIYGQAAKGPDGKIWLRPTALPIYCAMNAYCGTQMAYMPGDPASETRGGMSAGIGILGSLTYLPDPSVRLYRFGEIKIEIHLSRGTRTVFADGIQNHGFEPDPGFPYTVDLSLFTFTELKVILTPEKFFTYGGLYDEDTGKRV